MGYIQKVEHEIRELLANTRFEIEPEDEQLITAFVKEKVLESYRNGIVEGKNPKKKTKTQKK